MPIRQVMHQPKPDEFIDKHEPLGQAIHRFVMGCYQSLLVREGKTVIGVLRLTDVFSGTAAIMNLAG